MLEIRCSESGAVMQMRGMPSVCITAKRVCGARDAKHSTLSNRFSIRLRKS